MNYANIKEFDISNGPGIRLSLFVSGCEHKCRNCFNSIAWDFNYGKPFTDEVEKEILEKLQNPIYQGLSILGGEPLHPKNQEALLKFILQIDPSINIWIYSGYNYEELISSEVGKYSRRILELCNVLVDGKFNEDLKDISLNFRGSSNQRIIDIQKSIKYNKIILHPLGINDGNKYKK